MPGMSVRPSVKRAVVRRVNATGYGAVRSREQGRCRRRALRKSARKNTTTSSFVQYVVTHTLRSGRHSGELALRATRLVCTPRPRSTSNSWRENGSLGDDNELTCPRGPCITSWHGHGRRTRAARLGLAQGTRRGAVRQLQLLLLRMRCKHATRNRITCVLHGARSWRVYFGV